MQSFLKDKGIQTLIHYPIPSHKQIAYSTLNISSLPITDRIHNEILSLPISSILKKDSIINITRIINECYC